MQYKVKTPILFHQNNKLSNKEKQKYCIFLVKSKYNRSSLLLNKYYAL